MDLQALRKDIDGIDEDIFKSFYETNGTCARELQTTKNCTICPYFRADREQQVIDRIKNLTHDPELENGTAALFTTIMDISKILQNRKILAEYQNINLQFLTLKLQKE